MTDRRFSIQALVAGAAMLVASTASAATLEGANFQLDYLFPDASTVYGFTNGPIFGTVGPGTDAEIVLSFDLPTISLDFGALSLEVLLSGGDASTWLDDSFNGIRVTFLDPPFVISAFGLIGNSFSPVTPTFTATELFVNWAGASYSDGDTASFSIGLAPEPIPLPGALPLILAGLGAMGGIGLRRVRSGRMDATETT